MNEPIFLMECKKRQTWVFCAALAVVSAGAAAQSTPARFLVTSSQVIAAMQDRQLPVEGVQVKIAAAMTASTEEPTLEIQNIALLSAHTAQLRMACKNHTDCLPFYVSATWPQQSAALVIPMALRRGPGSAPSGAPVQPTVNAPLDQPVNAKPEGAPAVHAGDSVTLLMDHDRTHVRIRVVCLESGALGDKVRVTTPDHKQAYVAEIVTPGLLKGNF